MSYEAYRYIFIGGLVLSILMFVVTIVIFFLLKIKNVIGDLSGANARKGIENIRNQNQGEGKKSKPKSSTKQSGRKSAQAISESLMETSKIRTQDRYDNLDASETTALSDELTETSVLSEQMEETPTNPNFVIEIDITYVHSSEIIK